MVSVEPYTVTGIVYWISSLYVFYCCFVFIHMARVVRRKERESQEQPLNTGMVIAETVAWLLVGNAALVVFVKTDVRLGFVAWLSGMLVTMCVIEAIRLVDRRW